MLHVLLVHRGVIGEEKSAMMHSIGHWEAGLSVAIDPKRMQAQVPGGENSRFNSFRYKRLHDSSPLLRGIGEQAE